MIYDINLYIIFHIYMLWNDSTRVYKTLVSVIYVGIMQ